MKKHAFLFLALALAFALAPSLEAQTTITWRGRSLVGFSRRSYSSNDPIIIDGVKFGTLQGGGDPNVVEVGTEYTTGWRTIKTTVDKIGDTRVNGIEKTSIYTIKLTANQLLEVSGTSSVSGFTAPVFYVIRGPTELSLGFTENWPRITIGLPTDYDTMVFFDLDAYERSIAGQFVDKCVLPLVKYDDVANFYNKTRNQFWVYQSNSLSSECPEYIGCTCKGDVVQHMINSTALKQGFINGFIEAIPWYASALINALAESDKLKIKTSGILTAAIGYHYGWYPDRGAFNARFREDAIILLSGMDPPSGRASIILTAAGQEIVENFYGALASEASKIFNTVSSVPLIGNLFSFTVGAITTALDYRNIGDNAVDFFEEGGPNNWRLGTINSAFGNAKMRGFAYGNNISVAVGSGGKIAYFSRGDLSWTAVSTTANGGLGGKDLNAVAYGINSVGSGVFVAAGSGGVMAASTDGRSWTRVTSSFGSTAIQGVAFGGGRFVAVGNGGKTAYSTDGRTWTAVDAKGAFGMLSNDINAVAYGNNRWVAVGSNGKIAYSSNGQSWTAVPAASNGGFGARFHIRGITFGNGRFVAVGDNGKIAYSTNGTSWTQAEKSTIEGQINGVAYGNGWYVVVGHTGKMAVSADCKTWTHIAYTGFGTTNINAVTYYNGQFGAVGDSGKMAGCNWGLTENAVTPTPPPPVTGPDNWTAVSDSAFGTTPINGVAFGNNTWVAVGNGGKIAYSSNGTSWTALTPGAYRNPGESTFGGTNITAVAFGNGMFVAVGWNGKIAYSTNGQTWRAVPTASNGGFSMINIHGVAYGGGRWVAVGSSGKIAYSTNGQTWTAVPTASNGGFGTTINIHGVAYGGGRWVAVGDHGKMAYSSNGQSWTAVTNNGGLGTGRIASIAYYNNRWVAGYQNNRIAYSSDGASWTAVRMPNSNNAVQNSVYGIAFGNNRYVNVESRGTIFYSTDAASWTRVADSAFGSYHIYAVAYGNGRFVAVGQSGKMAYADW